MRTYKVDPRGRITLPKYVRQHLGVGPGDQIEFELLPDGGGVLMRAKPPKEVNGLANTLAEWTEESAKWIGNRD